MAKDSFNHKFARRILIVLLSFMGIIELWLWHEGHANNVGLVFGLCLLVGAMFLAWREYEKGV